VTRFSSSLELGAKTKVKPLMFVSTRPEGVIVEALFTLYMLGTARCWRRIKVKLNVSSSSLGRRIRKDGGPSLDGDDSGSCDECFSTGSYQSFREPYLNVVDHVVVAKLSLCAISSRREAVGCDVEEGAVAGVCDVD
jgi:hypothetical protein